ncbi:MAG: hypothetical protein EZS28_017051 [Streblomastix strix]|uniref:Uncharacterized protein n=1 Tax=Streblomastix strix TaxID=222440 RepID=A0A5J4VYI9_9EUKA|nr:MAG: hypothetical protein EZS28_017051 [Streblomastix strix]
MSICPAILNHPAIVNLMAYGLKYQYNAQRGFVTYDFDTLSDQFSIASTEIHPNRDNSYELIKRCYTLFDEQANDYQEQLENYGLPFNSSFVHLWLAQTFESAEQIYLCMKYGDEDIPFDKCV